MEGRGPGCRSRILTKVCTPELVDAAVAKHGLGELRRRLLPARLVVYFVLALCLFAGESYEEVIRVRPGGTPGSRVLARVNRPSLCRARVRLGEEVLETVFRQVAGPLAVPEPPGAWWRGPRLLASDGAQIADHGFWSVQFVHAFTTSGAHLPARPNRLDFLTAGAPCRPVSEGASRHRP